ncbi:CHAT domain-containing protein [Nostoc piscinale]|uniref:CHAT domain-containing protein n=1 Tax=Nostoc piscinale TaxID=224012 RepID=UPI000780BC67|nr:CHAT domain-containing protein [Nostoc piscinale]
MSEKNLTDINKISVFETQADAYQILQQVFIEQQNYDNALETAEKGRARAFVDLLNTRLSTKTNDSITQDLGTQLPNVQEVAQQQNATLVEYSIIYDEFKIQGKQQTKESELYIWVIKPTGKGTFQKVDIKPLWQKENTTLSQLVTMSRQSIGVRGRGIIISQNPDTLKTKQRFRRLHELLIKPIAEFLPTKESEKVIFIPQASLFLVPFPALQDKQGKYLIEKHTILTAPSIQVLDLTRKQKLASQELSKEEILVVGNPTMPKLALEFGKSLEQLPSLPGAEQEAKNVAAIFKTQALIGKEASKTTILEKISQARIIHFATHGLLDDNRGLGSAIALAPSDKDNGLLTAEEILNLKLNADLVVLSACDTGRGRVTGDGVIGLSRSLISAGVPSVIVSLWAVDDNSTSFLMTEFYKNLQQKQDKVSALRQAMLTTMQKYPLPKNWAAFTLIGESE